ncbi:MAG: 2-C-methyl-D-erythritol 2,4-cyclodiphosphate synthase [Erysipelothrix sp.]|nr:2-C-methyl-D-erythritol 2,4-cyclodiphosphate synthase [Erysipelothrix sp.]
MIRIGQSTDIHQLAKGRDLILGGVKIESELGLVGHSDADVLTHVICEAILGALALGDIGKHFPDTDPKYKGIQSILLLEQVVDLMKAKGYSVVNIDALVIIEKPKLADYIDLMKRVLCPILEVHWEQLNIKATRGEKMGFVGRQEGVMAQAVCLLEKEEEK